jgi:hypothetical protein
MSTTPNMTKEYQREARDLEKKLAKLQGQRSSSETKVDREIAKLERVAEIQVNSITRKLQAESNKLLRAARKVEKSANKECHALEKRLAVVTQRLG